MKGSTIKKKEKKKKNDRSSFDPTLRRLLPQLHANISCIRRADSAPSELDSAHRQRKHGASAKCSISQIPRCRASLCRWRIEVGGMGKGSASATQYLSTVFRGAYLYSRARFRGAQLIGLINERCLSTATSHYSRSSLLFAPPPHSFSFSPGSPVLHYSRLRIRRGTLNLVPAGISRAAGNRSETAARGKKSREMHRAAKNRIES